MNLSFNTNGTYSYDPATWAISGAAGAAATRGAVSVSGGAILTPEGAREYARRVCQAADDAERQMAA
jgi:hypothetical protein